jgi:ELWxxDGT repeat protein
MRKSLHTLFITILVLAIKLNAHGQIPYLIKDIVTKDDMLFGSPREILTDGTDAYFIATDSLLGAELFVSDGTAIGTKVVQNESIDNDANGIGVKTSEDNYRQVVFNNSVYYLNYKKNTIFSVNTNGNGASAVFTPVEIGTCGTPPNTTSVTDTLDIWELSVAGNTMYVFTLEHTCDYNTYGNAIYTSNDGINFTRSVELGQVKSFQVGFANGNNTDINQSGHFAYGNKLLFTGSVLGDDSLYITDGTQAGTIALKKNYGNSTSGWQGFANSMIEYNGKLLFSTFEPSMGNVIYETDGTIMGTTVLKDLMPSKVDSTGLAYYNASVDKVNGNLYFWADNDSGSGVELFKSNGTAPGTVLVKDIAPGIFSSIFAINYCTAYQGKFYFSVPNTGVDGIAGLYETDGTPAGTKKIHPVVVSSNIEILNGLMVFGGYEVDSVFNTEMELWVSNGTTNGTRMMYDIFPGIDASSVTPNSAQPQKFTKIGNALYFIADYQGGREVFKLNSAAIPSSIENIGGKSAIYIYPNPTQGQFTIKFAEEMIQARLKIISVKGELMHDENMYSNEVKINCILGTGIYFVLISNNGINHMQKLVIE